MEFNIMNLITGSVISFKDNDNYIIQRLDFGQAVGRHSATQYIDLVGAEVDATVLGTRDILIEGVICGSSIYSLSEAKARLNRFINPRHDIKLSRGDYYMVARPDGSIKYSSGYQENNQYFCRFIIQCSAYMPAFKRINEEVFYYSSSIKLPLFPMAIPKAKGICFGKKAASNTQNLINDGDIETGFISRLTAQYGAVINPKIVNNLTGKYIEIILGMEKGDVVEISTETGNKYVKFIRGETETDIFKCITKRSTMSMTLNTGRNNISILAAKDTANLSSMIKLTPLYLEVQE